jgi:hypothetical protein
MKNFKLLFASLAMVTLAFVSLSGFTTSRSMMTPPNDDAQLIGRARGAANPCIGQAHNSFSSIEAQVEDIGICFVSGNLKRVSFYRVTRCNEQQQDPCPRPFVELVATVDFDCEENIIAVQCYPVN